MLQYLQMMLSLYKKYAGWLFAMMLSEPERQQRLYATSTSPSTVVPLLSGQHENDGLSEHSLSRKRRRQSHSFSSTSSGGSSLNENKSSDDNRGEKRQRQLDFTELSKIIPHQIPNGASSLWYIVVTAACLGFHHEPGVGELWHYISSLGGERSQQLAVARRIREACLKASVLVGFPRVCTLKKNPDPCSLNKLCLTRHKINELSIIY